MFQDSTRPIRNVPNTHAFLHVGGRHFIAQTNHKLCDLLDVDDVLCLLAFTGLNDFGAASHLFEGVVSGEKCVEGWRGGSAAANTWMNLLEAAVLRTCAVYPQQRPTG